MEYSVVPMKQEHRHQVVDIYNYFIENTFAAYPETAMDDSIFDRFLALSQDYISLVAKDQSNNVIGFAFLQPYHPADSFRKTAVAAYFIMPGHTRKGVGSKILGIFIQKLKGKGIEHLLVNISSLNPGSVEFHRKNGFKKCGTFENIGSKAGKDFGVIWMQKEI